MNAVLARRLGTPAVVTALGVVLSAGVAGAFYRSVVKPSGTGSATPVASQPLTLAATGTVSTGLYPGGPGAQVTVTVTNPYTRPITVTAVSAAGTVTATPVGGRTCTASAVSVGTPTAGLPATVPASSTGTITLTGLATMAANADNGCQGATFTIPFQVSGKL